MSRCAACSFYYEGTLIRENLCMNGENAFQRDADGETTFARTEANLTCAKFNAKPQDEGL